ncbi:hypothetical protein GS454_01410 [Rhodococcus hoagii]|nr:hypothetical protein [Prescottella equi]
MVGDARGDEGHRAVQGDVDVRDRTFEIGDAVADHARTLAVDTHVVPQDAPDVSEVAVADTGPRRVVVRVYPLHDLEALVTENLR